MQHTGIAIMNNVRLIVFKAGVAPNVSLLVQRGRIEHKLDVPVKEGTRSHPMLITVVAHATINLSRQNRNYRSAPLV